MKTRYARPLPSREGWTVFIAAIIPAAAPHTCCPLHEFLARQAAQIASDAKFFSYVVERGGNSNANREWFPIRFSHGWHGRNSAIRKSYVLIARAPCPLVDVLKQMFVNRFDMFGVELPCGTKAGIDFGVTRFDQSCFNAFKLGVIRYSESILDGIRTLIGVVGHALRDAIEELKLGNDLGDLNIAVDVSSEDRIGLGVGRDSFNPIIGIAPAYALKSNE